MKTSLTDLEIATNAVDAMASTTNFVEFEKSWQDYLIRLERAWEAASRAVESYGKAQAWISNNAHLRKKDPLLRYLKNARNAETHVVEPTVSHSIGISVKDRLGRPFKLESTSVSFENGVLTFDINTPDKHISWDAELLPGDPHLLRFKCRGAWHNPPFEHLGQRIRDIHPVAVANLGLAFYRGRIHEAREITKQSKGPGSD